MNGSAIELGLTTHAHPSISEVLMELGLKVENRGNTRLTGGTIKMIDYKSVGLSEEDLKEIYKWMDLGRKVDERLWLLNRAGKIPFVVSGQGQEATQIGMAYAMKEGDISSPYYRDLAFVTFMGISPYDTMLASFGKRMILILEENKCPPTLVIVKGHIITKFSVATQIPHSVGAALALKWIKTKYCYGNCR